MAVTLIALLVAVLALCVAFVKYRYSYWARRNVPFIEPQFPFGNFKDANRKSLADVATEQYNLMKDQGPFCGLFFFIQPLIMITDLDLVKTIFIKDFNYFPDRGVYHNPRDDPLSAHLFALEGNKWRSLRARLSPTFTLGKMKMMFPTLKAVGDNFSEFLVQTVGTGNELELKDYMARFTMDVVGSCAFGIECNSFRDPHSQFRKCGRRFFDHPRHSTMVRTFLRLFPELGQMLRVKWLNDDAAGFFYKLVTDTIGFRQQNAIERNDFMSLLIEMKKRGELTMDETAAQSFIFFLAGFETASSNQTYCMYELSQNPQYQEKARECVLAAIKKHGGLTYDAICDMQYLDQCINETFRLYPSVPVLERKAFRDYRIPGTDVVIPRGMKVHVPSFAIHRDERHYPDPLRFDPDRFSPEEVAKRHACAFLAFGEGPRICIGRRFGVLQARVGLANVLSRFRISTCPRTAIPLEYSARSSVLLPKEGLWLKVEPL